jgi:hypothetical protein
MTRRRWLLASVGLPLSRAVALMAEAPRLGVTWDGDNLHISAPTLRFLAGKPLERLENGATVVFLSQLSLSTDGTWNTPFRRVQDRLVVSYDLWEKKFSVTRLGHAAQSRGRMSAAEAQQWCVDSLVVSSTGMAPDRPYWLRLEMRVADPKELSSAVGQPGISITKLVEIFSRKPGIDEQRWALEAGPFKLSELVRIQPRRGPRTG